MKKLFILIMFLIIVFLSLCSFAEDGTYDATVITDSGTYTVPVEVEGSEVTYVYWPNGGNMHVYGADIEDGFASGTNSRGDFVNIEIDGYNEE